MKITDFNQRVQAFYEHCTEESDGDFTITLEAGEWIWAKISPLSFRQNTAQNEATPYQNQYEIIMHKKHNSDTRHAYLRQLRWNHKLLTICTPWLETSDMTHIKALAREEIEEEHNG